MAASASKARSGFHDFLIRELAVLSLRLGAAYEEDVASRQAQVQSGRPEEAEDDDDDDDDDEQVGWSRARFKWRGEAEDELGPPLPFKVLPLWFASPWTRRTVRTPTGAGIPVNLSVGCEDVDYKEDGHSTAMGSSVPQHFPSPRSPRTAALARLDAELAAAQLGAEPDAATSAAGPSVPQSSAEPAGEEPGGASPEAGGAGGPGAAGGTGGRPPGSAAEGAAAAAGASAEADGVGGPAAEAAGAGLAPAGAGGGAAGEARAAAEAAGAGGEAAEKAEAAGAGAEAGAEAAIAGGEAAEAAGAGGQAVEEAGAGAEAAGDAEEAAGAAKGPVEAAGAGGAAAEVARAGGVATRARGTVAEAAGASSEAHGPGGWRDQAVGLRAEAGEESEDQPDTAQSRGRESATGPARLGVAPAAAGPCAASSSGGAASAPGAASSSGGGGASGGRLLEEHKKRRLEELGADMPAELMQKMEKPRVLDSLRTAYSRQEIAEAAKIVRARAAAPHPTPEQKRPKPRMVSKFQVVLTCTDGSKDADSELIRLLEGHSEIGYAANVLFFNVLWSAMRDQADDPGVLEARFKAFVDDAVQKAAQLQSRNVSHFHVSQGKYWGSKMQQHARRLAAALAGGAPTTLAVGHFMDRVLQDTLPTGKGVALCEAAWQHEGEGTLGLMSDLYPSMKVIHVVSDEDEQRGAPEPDPRVAEGHRRAREWGEAHPERYAQVRCTPDLRAAERQVPGLLCFLGLTDQSDSMIRLYRRTPPLLRRAESCRVRAS